MSLTNHAAGKIIVCSAPSGAGKSTLLDHVMSVVPNLVYSVSATTRAPRGNEVHGREYYFISQKEFRNKIDAGEFAEWEQVHENYYGTPKSSIDEAISTGKHVVMDIDVKGKVMLDKSYPDAHGIFIGPPSMEVLEQRLRSRQTDSDEAIAVRLSNAQKEINFAHTQGKYEYTIVNDDLGSAKEEIVRIVKRILTDKAS